MVKITKQNNKRPSQHVSSKKEVQFNSLDTSVSTANTKMALGDFRSAAFIWIRILEYLDGQYLTGRMHAHRQIGICLQYVPQTLLFQIRV
jgi:hypothetical protein